MSADPKCPEADPARGNRCVLDAGHAGDWHLYRRGDVGYVWRMDGGRHAEPPATMVRPVPTGGAGGAHPESPMGDLVAALADQRDRLLLPVVQWINDALRWVMGRG